MDMEADMEAAVMPLVAPLPPAATVEDMAADTEADMVEDTEADAEDAEDAATATSKKKRWKRIHYSQRGDETSNIVSAVCRRAFHKY